MKERKTLWMRYVDFERVKDILHLIYQSDGKLRAGVLEQLSVEKGILVKKENGSPFSHSALYHYRKVMEGLCLVEARQKFYFVSKEERVKELIRLTNFKQEMSSEAKEVLRELIINNSDCRKFFFDVFMEEDNYTLEDFRKEGKHVIVETKSLRESLEEERAQSEKTEKRGGIQDKKQAGIVIIKNLSSGRELELKTQDEIHAIYWGIRLWSLELGITDEFLTSFKEGRIIYPVYPCFSDKDLMRVLLTKIKEDQSPSEWVLLHIPTLIKEIALTQRIPVDEIKKFIHKLRRLKPGYVMLIPSSTMFIEIKTPFKMQDKIILKSYLNQEGVGYISHLRVNKRILEEIQL
uniref:Uncharacterized protein n=1 Tax=candidate division CPR3 bacterium TaxID=2268181 RepID=A0A7V3N447_UNCC3